MPSQKKRSSRVVTTRSKKKASRRKTPRPSAGRVFEDLLALQARLRAPGGCPWDREQTHQSLRAFLIEEAYETLDALESGNDRQFASELGDLLLQIVFHSLIASETRRFDIRDVIESVHTKMVRRHPHVFGDVKARTSAQVLKNWERLKAEERRAESGSTKRPASDPILKGVSRSLPALMEANLLTTRAAHIGFDWPNFAGLLEKLGEEIGELRRALAASGEDVAGRPRTAPSHAVEEEVGDLLFVVANIARFLGLDPEIALKKANHKFVERFNWMGQESLRHGVPLPEAGRDKMEDLWNQSKARR